MAAMIRRLFSAVIACALALAVAVCALAAALSAAPAARAAITPDPMCGQFNAVPVTSGGTAYSILTDAFGGQPECVSYGTRPAFTVVSSGVVRRGPVQAYPHIVTMSPPARVTAPAGHLTWYTRTAGASGLWAAGAEMWITRGPAPAKPAIRAELMIWADTAPGLYARASRKVIVRVDGARWYVLHWGHPVPGSWNYVQFRRVRPVTHVRGLALSPFLAAAIRLGYVRRRWYRQSLEAGFEIWKGGAGLATTWLRVRP